MSTQTQQQVKSNTSQSAHAPKREFAPRPKVAFWKPKKEGEGAAAIVEVGDAAFFLTMMPQGKGENSFIAENKMVAKLGVADIGEIINVLRGIKEGLGKKNDKGYFSGLYHENDKGNSVIGLSYSKDIDRFNFSLSKSSDEVKNRLNVSLTSGEATILLEFFIRYIDVLFLPSLPRQ